MSAKVTSLVWDYYNPATGGAPLILAIALADEADDVGGGIFQSLPNLAKKTRQTERAVRKQMRALEAAGLLICVQKSAGGAGNFSQFRIDLAKLIVLKNPERRPGITRNVGPGYLDQNPEQGTGFSDPPYIGLKEEPLVQDPGTRNGTHLEAEDERLAKWMLGKLRELNPKHREPSWRTWLRDIRLMRERDTRTHRDIAALFAWANADPFWRTNILSPAKLREKWDQLELKRRTQPGGVQTSGQPEDRTCVEHEAGTRCARLGGFKGGDGRWRCAAHRDREHAHQEIHA